MTTLSDHVVTQTKLVSLHGDCIVSDINRSYRTLVEAFQSEGSIVIDLSKIEAADITLVQLIVSASKTATQQGREFSLISVPKIFEDTLLLAGVDFNVASGRLSA